MRWSVGLLALAVAVSGCKKKPPKPAAASTTDPAPVEVVTEAPEARLARAEALLRGTTREDWAAARDLLLKLSEAAPDDPIPRLDLGVSWYKLGELEQAASEFARVTRTRPEIAVGWRYLAEVEVALGDPEAALRHLRTGIEAAPEDAGLRVSLISTLRSLGRHAEAVDAAAVALRLNSRSLPVYDQMGQAWLDQGMPDRARFVYEKASTITGADADAQIQSGFGQVLWARGERYAAEARFKKALEADADNLRALVLYSRILLDDRNWAAALPMLERAQQLDPTNHGVAVDLGTVYRGLGRLDEAEAAWRRALQLDPGDPTPHFNLAVLAGDDRRDLARGISAMKDYLSAGGADPLAQTYLASFQKDTERAAQRRKQEEDKARREKERQERERLLKEEEARQQEGDPPPAEPAPTGPWGPQPTEGGGG